MCVSKTHLQPRWDVELEVHLLVRQLLVHLLERLKLIVHVHLSETHDERKGTWASEFVPREANNDNAEHSGAHDGTTRAQGSIT
jgi:hypothetical protein